MTTGHDTPAKLLAEAQNAAGARANAASKREDYRSANVWRQIAADIDALRRRAIQEITRG